MKLVLFQSSIKEYVYPGILTDNGVISLENEVTSSYTPQHTMEGLIDDFENYRKPFEELLLEPKLSYTRPFQDQGKSLLVLATIGNMHSVNLGNLTCFSRALTPL